jgi:UDP-N-acetyl-2-amino-2-deoxyglucuronate dehydrogenase
MEAETGKRINTILQLRLHPTIVDLKNKMQTIDKKVDIDLTYITSRGRWYLVSWKGDASKSGGIATNIGIHFFDMLQWVFGKCVKVVVHLYQQTRAAGYMEFEKARVRWFLSLDRGDLPEPARRSGKTTFRSIMVDSREIEFSEGFTDLHTDSYRAILEGKGFGLEDARPSVEIVHNVRTAKESRRKGDYHPLLKAIKD